MRRLAVAGSGAIVASVALTATALASSVPDETSIAGSTPTTVECDRPTEVETVKVGIRPTLTFATFYVAAGLGYFEDENLDVSFEVLDTANIMPLISSGDIDAGMIGLTGGYLNARNQDLDVMAVASTGVDATPNPPKFFVRTDLIESGEVTEMADLAGMTIGMPGPLGAGPTNNVAAFLGTGGLGLLDVNYQNVEFQQMQEAFANGAIDAAYVTAGFADPLIESDVARPFGDQEAALVGNTGAGMIFGSRLLEDRPDIGRAVLRAMARAAERLQDPDYRNDPEIIAALVEQGDFTEEDVRNNAVAGFFPDLHFNEDTIVQLQQALIDADLLDYDEPLPFDEIIADSFRAEAVASLDACVTA